MKEIKGKQPLENLTIRAETSADDSAIYHLVRAAFEHAEHTDHNEQDLVNRLRASAAYVPELALVAELNGELVGYLLLTVITVGGQEALALGPLAVLPPWQGLGVGGNLIHAGHEAARKLGYRFSILVGHADYYPRFGYRSAASFGMTCPFEVPAENFMACPLQPTAERLEGVVEYPEAWGL